MGKNTRANREHSKEQKLAKENKELKKELSYLRKQIARLDGNRCEDLRQMVVEQEETKAFEENIAPMGSNLEELKKIWACRKCDGGVLEIILYPKLGVTNYYRKCSLCLNRTKGQRYGETVKGIIKNDEI